ncbi:hypothetical protein [Timonella sp. A28]|uniref:hypothetical protein n=1 Tax=Timonella sp. A28 TaxID=3442640 RepID=UPI003EB8F766
MTRRITAVGCVAAAVAASFVITGCTPDLPTPKAATEVTLPALDEAQSTAVITAVSETLATADEDKAAKKLSDRVTGPALDMRKAEYKIAKSQKKDDSISELPAGMQSVFMTTSTAWPRTIFAVSDRPQNLEVERFMVYTQDTPQDPYKLWGWFPLFPGLTVPAFPTLEEGTTEISELDESLSVMPKDVLDDYMALLKSASKKNKEKFDLEKDEFYKEISDRRKYLKDAAKQIEGSYKETFKVGDEWRALRTLDGGAVLVSTFETVGTLKGETGAIVSPSAIEKAFLDGKTAKNALSVTRTAVVGFYIPPKGSEEKPRAIGRLLRTTDASIPK